MEGESDLVLSRKLYLEKTPHRMSGMIHCLSAMQDDCQGQTDQLRRLLQEQAKASHCANYESIARLCQSMEDCLAKIDSHIEKPQLETAISSLMEACQLISEHAETIAGMTNQYQHLDACK